MRECNRKPRHGLAALSLAALLVAAACSPALAEAGGIFAGLEGAWSGEGTVRLTDGSTSPLHCRATYAVSGGGDHLDQSLDCASQRQKFTFHIEIDQTNGAILGAWQETTRQVQGGVSGQGVPGKIEIAAHGQGFSAQVTAVTRGARQSIALSASGGGFSSASIALRRGR